MVSVFVALSRVIMMKECDVGSVIFSRIFFLFLKTVLFFQKIIFIFKNGCAHRA
jgi:hypothetical protein|tara:strand:+ start:835 stop:996 length:162 start_codon:yes stop_codon:yes gene_type:complete